MELNKSLEDYFCDWEENLFGYGYGSGDRPILQALKMFFSCFKKVRDIGSYSYDYRDIERRLGEGTTWLLINILCKAKHIEYRTSPRLGWCTKSGDNLRSFLADNSLDRLSLIIQRKEKLLCSLTECHCKKEDCRSHNPFWIT